MWEIELIGMHIMMQENRKENGNKMALTRRQFDILELLIENDYSQRQMCEKTGMSQRMINRTISELTDIGLVQGGQITAAGKEAMEPYKVKRAVFFAAGLGSRLVPITFNTPKPLVRIHGERIIAGLIDACLEAGIEEIYIVRGYLADQFDFLLKKYPMLRFLENLEYKEANNISSALVASHLFSNAYVLEADILMEGNNLLKKYHYLSNILGVKKEYSDDWCGKVKNGTIRELTLGGTGDDNYRLYGISYWNNEDGARLAEDIDTVYNSAGGKELYWDQVPLVFCKDHYVIELRECRDGDLVEIDTYGELKEIDRTYDV